MSKTILVFSSVGFGVGSFVVAVSLGSLLTVTTGIPLLGGLLNGVLTAMVLTVGLISTRFFGTATIMWLVFSVLASFTTTLGPVGIYKVGIGVMAGLIWDTVYLVSGHRRVGLFLGGMIGSASIMFLLVIALKLGFGEQATVALAKYQSAFLFILAVNLVVTFVGIMLGEAVYSKRLSELSVFKNLQKHAR